MGFTSKILIRHILNGGNSMGSVISETFICVVNDHTLTFMYLT